ncbi:hypothetical protein ABET41_15040 [Metabacillus fastidiosus]|uniref:Uncharacterized protein n=1 Tax=Metabacillus fastidiosus TaxID=1458 RepID=A0ABU6P4I5_9BACI|nr:hypothetical protein [Metabacillus fastidiosus]MED4403975.1 hypothetical protein [Metabacillus fastidiosus]MED4461099.1 hypothetical protein [Metabacillus fastidiosus]
MNGDIRKSKFKQPINIKARVKEIEGIKVGKNEKNLSETLKDGVQKGIKTVAGWFK